MTSATERKMASNTRLIGNPGIRICARLALEPRCTSREIPAPAAQPPIDVKQPSAACSNAEQARAASFGRPFLATTILPSRPSAESAASMMIKAPSPASSWTPFVCRREMMFRRNRIRNAMSASATMPISKRCNRGSTSVDDLIEYVRPLMRGSVPSDDEKMIEPFQ
jgi:hypothetical protein